MNSALEPYKTWSDHQHMRSSPLREPANQYALVNKECVFWLDLLCEVACENEIFMWVFDNEREMQDFLSLRASAKSSSLNKDIWTTYPLQSLKSRVRSRNKKKRKPMKAPQSLHPQAIWHTWTWISDVGNSQLCCVDLMSMYDLCSNKHQALYTKPKSVKNFYDFWSSCDTTSLKAIMLLTIRENAYCLLIALEARQTAPRMVKPSTCRTRFAMMWQVYESKIGESWCIMLHMSLHSTTLE